MKFDILPMLEDVSLMADRGRVVVVEERLALVAEAIRDECRVLKDTFAACSEMGDNTWAKMDSEHVAIDRVKKIYALHAERKHLVRLSQELAQSVKSRMLTRS